MRTNRLLILAAVLSLVINLVLFARVGELNDQMHSLANNFNSMQSGIMSISNNVSNTLNQFTKEQSWITPAQVNNEKTNFESDKGQVVLDWQIKDFQEGSEVTLYYSYSDAAEFKPAAPQRVSDGFFEAGLPVEIKIEPFWDIQVSRINGRSTSVEAAMEAKHANFIRYYVSMKTKDVVKSSEVTYLDLSYLSKVKYGPITGNVSINNNKYTIDLFQRDPIMSGFESVTAKFYNGSDLVAEKPLEAQQKPGNPPKTYSLTYDAGAQKPSHVVIQVKYSNGNTFEREIGLGV